MSELSMVLRDVMTERLPILERGFRLVDRARALVQLRGCELGAGVMSQGRLVVAVAGRAHIGAHTCFVAGPVPTVLCVAAGAHLDIGRECHFNYGVSFDVARSVRVGDRCFFGSYVSIGDAGPEDLRPVVLGCDVWVAHGATIQPGVTIGDGAVIAAGAVVGADVPPGMLAMGNPARVMSQQLSASAAASSAAAPQRSSS